MHPMRKYIDIVEAAVDADIELPDSIRRLFDLPGEEEKTNPTSYQVIIFNDEITPGNVAVMAVAQGAGLDMYAASVIVAEAHENGVAVVKVFSVEAEANQCAENIMRAARNNHQFDFLKTTRDPGVPAYPHGPRGYPGADWPMTAEVMEIPGN